MEYLKIYENLVIERPNEIAIEAYGEKITYLELDLKSSGAAMDIQKELIDKESVVAICSNGTIENFIAILGCIKSGIPFINLDVTAPKEYIDLLCRQLSIKLYLYSEGYQDAVSNEIPKKNIKKLNYTKQSEYSCKISELNYFVATSGTTGIPKIVKKTEKSLINSFNQMKMAVPMIFNTTVQQYATLSFAFGLDQTLIMLIGGTKICVDKKSEYINLEELYLNIEKNRAKVVFLAASIIKLLSKQPDLFEKIPSCLKYIVVGGEPLVVSADFIFELRNRKIKLLNNYGCTETGTVFFSLMEIQLLEIEQYNKVAIGKPLPSFLAVILNEQLLETNKGELYIGMDKFTNSYLDISIHEKLYFLKKYPEKVFYKMGDIAEKLKGKYYIIGRNDNCVNVKGYRVEIENVENIISQIIKGNECCVVPIENNYKEINLVCYYCYDLIDEKDLKKRLYEYLPNYMIPVSFIKTKKLVHSKNGKLDRKEMKLKYEEYLQGSNLLVNESEMKVRLKNLVENMLSIKLSEDCYSLTFQEIGLDSLGVTDYICTVEKQENIKIEDTALSEVRFDSIDTLVKYIRGKKNE